MYFTPKGIFTSVNLLQLKKELSPILVTFFPPIILGMVTSLTLPIYLVISTVPSSSSEYS